MTKMWFIIELCLGLVLSLPYCVNTFFISQFDFAISPLETEMGGHGMTKSITGKIKRSFHVRNYQNISLVDTDVADVKLMSSLLVQDANGTRSK